MILTFPSLGVRDLLAFSDTASNEWVSSLAAIMLSRHYTLTLSHRRSSWPQSGASSSSRTWGTVRGRSRASWRSPRGRTSRGTVGTRDERVLWFPNRSVSTGTTYLGSETLDGLFFFACHIVMISFWLPILLDKVVLCWEISLNWIIIRTSKPCQKSYWAKCASSILLYS